MKLKVWQLEKSIAPQEDGRLAQTIKAVLGV